MTKIMIVDDEQDVELLLWESNGDRSQRFPDKTRGLYPAKREDPKAESLLNLNFVALRQQ